MTRDEITYETINDENEDSFEDLSLNNIDTNEFLLSDDFFETDFIIEENDENEEDGKLNDKDESESLEEVDKLEDFQLYLRVQIYDKYIVNLERVNFFEVKKNNESPIIISVNQVIQVYGCFTLKKGNERKRYFFVNINKFY